MFLRNRLDMPKYTALTSGNIEDRNDFNGKIVPEKTL
jgi:hypothetical protein